MEKVCRKCGKIKLLSDFTRDSRRKDGHHPYCLMCRSIENRNRDQRKAQEKYINIFIKQSRICHQCHINKPATDYDETMFNKTSGYVACKACQIAKKQRYDTKLQKLVEYAAANSDRMKELARIRTAKYRDKNKLFLVKMLGGKCMKCGLEISEKYPIVCFDFHHRDSSIKEYDMGHMLNAPRKHRDKLIAEAKKCDLLCAMCHRIYHWKQRQVSL